MIMRGTMRLMEHFAQMLMRRPWLPAALVGIPYALSLMAFAALFANQCYGTNRCLPELTDRAIVALASVREGAEFAGVLLGVALLLCPIIPLCKGWRRSAAIMLACGICVFLVKGAVQNAIPFTIRMAVAEQIRTAQFNLESKAAALRDGKPWQRCPIVRYERHCWYFNDERYVVHGSSADGGRYALTDERWRRNQCAPDTWDSRRLLTDVVAWHETGNRLLVTTAGGNRYFLNYATGMLEEAK